jgi:hypothetical protein
MFEFPAQFSFGRVNWSIGARLLLGDRRGKIYEHLRTKPFNVREGIGQREITEFCLRTDPVPINRLGQLCRVFANMKHEVLEWSPTSGQLFASIEDPEQEFAGDR